MESKEISALNIGEHLCSPIFNQIIKLPCGTNFMFKALNYMLP